MRTISLVKRLKWSFSGNMNPHALVIGDIDNDGENEFVVGNLNGDLAIFKGHCEDGFPSYACRGLGTITCIAIGDVQNTGKNSLVVINAEGHAHIFDLTLNKRVHTDQHISVDDYLKGGRRSSDTASVQAFKRMMSAGPIPMNAEEQQQQRQQQQQQQQQQQDTIFNSPQIYDLGKPNITLKVPVNVNKILIADIDNDHLNELILARTDRILHAFQLVSSDSQQHTELYKGVQTPSFTSLSPSTSFLSLASMQQKKVVKEDTSRKIHLLDKKTWVFDGQISSLCTTTHPDRPNEPLLLVAQPGNTFTIIDKEGQRYNKDMTPQKSRHSVPKTPPSSSTTDKTEAQIKELLCKQLPEQHHMIQITRDPSVEEHPTHLKRSNYIVHNWLAHDTNYNDDMMDGDDIESGAVATEIVMGKRHIAGESCATSEVGMLSMDGKFSIYDLKTMTVSQRDLYVTHKLFSLATLNVSHASANQPKPSPPTLHINHSKPFRYAQHTHGSGTHTPVSNTSHLRFSSTPRKGSLNSRSSSKASFVGYIRNQVKQTDDKSSEEEEEDKESTESSSTSSDSSEDSKEDLMENEAADEDKESDSEYGWSEGESDTEDEPGCDLFVACAWNGVTYLIDWSKKIEDDDSSSNTEEEERAVDQNNIKYQLIKFAFEGRVCAFTAGLYAVENHVNVPCLFYVDFEDQIYVYYDVHITPGPVTGFIDTIDDDVEEALDRIMGIESGIESLLEQNDQARTTLHPHSNEKIDLGDGWEGIADDDDDEETKDEEVEEDSRLELEQVEDTDPLNLADFIHECLYGFHDMKERMETEMTKFEKSCLSSNRLPPGGDVRRLSDLNITIEPLSLEDESHSESGSIAIDAMCHLAEEEEDEERLYSKRHLSEEPSEGYNNDTHIASWIEGSLMNTSMFSSNKDHDTESLSSNSS
ncbi:hypothetical protein EDC96DRAFT_508328 [Choanephora cucurbitarum]|nr:hypothetical protein EDC96DRAFT_508328 [Choanephora cucurbitarum]